MQGHDYIVVVLLYFYIPNTVIHKVKFKKIDKAIVRSNLEQSTW